MALLARTRRGGVRIPPALDKTFFLRLEAVPLLSFCLDLNRCVPIQPPLFLLACTCRFSSSVLSRPGRRPRMDHTDRVRDRRQFIAAYPTGLARDGRVAAGKQHFVRTLWLPGCCALRSGPAVQPDLQDSRICGSAEQGPSEN